MLGWFQKLMPREDNFFEMYTRHMATVTAGAVELRGLLRKEGDFAAHASEIGRQERLADEIMRELLLAVRRTFITPFDRSDVAGLGTALDDAIDQMQRCAKKMDLFDMRSFEPKMVEMGEVIVEAAELIGRMVAMLPDMRANNARISALNVQMAKLEEKADGEDMRKQLILHVQTGRALAMDATPSFAMNGTGVGGWPGPKTIARMVKNVRACERITCS